jgi:hypothetical protein
MTRQRIPKIRILSAFVLSIAVLTILTVFAGSATAQNPVPFIDQPLVPDATAPGGAGFTLTVNGAGFVAASTVNWNGSPLATTFISDTQLTATVPASDIATASTAAVTVANPNPGGVSNTQFFSIAVAGGSVSFLPAVTYNTGGYSSSLVVADVNGDGKPDLIVANWGNTRTVGVLLGNGDGTFQPARLITNLGFIALFNALAVADVNGDGKLDLIVATCCESNGDGEAAVLLGNGDGTFQAPVFYDSGGLQGGPLAVADLTGNGIPDIVMANWDNSTGNVGVLLGNGDGTFQPALISAAPVDPSCLTIADVNRDGKLDALVCSEDSVAVLLGNGNGTFQSFTSTNFPTGFCTFAVAIADVNGDGLPDMVAPNAGPDSCSPTGFAGILLGDGNSTLFHPEVNYEANSNAGIGAVAVSDLNGDGKLDVMVTAGGYGPGSVGVLLGNGDGTFQAATSYGTGGTGSHAIVAADLNGDGRPDIVVVNFSSSTVSVLLNNTVPCVGKCLTSVALASSLNPSIYGQKVTWTATVTTSGSITPTRKVNFTWDGYSIGTATLNASGVATLTKSNLNVYTYPLTAVYSGDANNAGSTSAILSQVVKGTTSAATLSSSPNPSTHGQAVTFTATITSPTVTPTGPVAFTAGTTVLGTAQLSGGKAKFTTSTLPLGATKVTATYNGDSNIAKSSASVTQTVQP